MTSKLIHSTSIFQDGALQENSWALLTQDQTITGVGRDWESHSADEIIDGTDQILHSGLIDTHCHGAAGFAANRGVEDIKGILDFNFSNQVSRTIVSLVSEDVGAMAKIATDARALNEDPRFIGIHFEGPFLSHDHRGAQNPAAIKLPTDDELTQIIDSGTAVSITLAPEYFTEAQLSRLASAGIRLCFGHSGADYDLASKFFGAHPGSVMTHTFNGMKGIHHRGPGPIPAALETETFMELIADGIHVHASVGRLIPKDRLILVTDAIEATGQPDGDYLLGVLPITVSEGVARTESGNLAGSTLKLIDAVKNYAQFSGSQLAAMRAVVTNPAAAYGLVEQEITLGTHFLL